MTTHTHHDFIELSFRLDSAGLVWRPEIGDEITNRDRLDSISILVDPQGMTPSELRRYFLWLPTVEQLVSQLEARQAIIYHAGVKTDFSYETVIKTSTGIIEASANTLRLALGQGLQKLLVNSTVESIH